MTTQFSATYQHNQTQLFLVGTWQDLAAYYIGEDGTNWSYQNRSFVKLGSWRNLRGTTIDGRPMSDLALDNRRLATFPENTRCIHFLESGQQVTQDLPHRRFGIGGFQVIKVSEFGSAKEQLAVCLHDGSGAYFVHPSALQKANIESYATAR